MVALPRLLLLPDPAARASPPREAEASRAFLASPAPGPAPPPRKRQRLAHLSPEEKALRRKLKNRVAAQSARDRKKARMGELERQAVEMEAQNQRLSEENRRLREEAQGLASENHELRLRLAGLLPSDASANQLASPVKKEEEPEEDGQGGEGGALRAQLPGPAESAALGPSVPLQKGQARAPRTDTPPTPRPRTPPWALLWLLAHALSLACWWACWTRRSSCWRRGQKKAMEAESKKRAGPWGRSFPYGAPPFLRWGPRVSSWRPLMDAPAPPPTTSTPSPSPGRGRPSPRPSPSWTPPRGRGRRGRSSPRCPRPSPSCSRKR